MPPDPFNVGGPDPLMVQRAVENHETRLDTLEAISGGTTTYTRTIRLPLSSLRVFDAVKDALPDSPANDDLGLADAAGSTVISSTADGGGTAQITQKFGADVALPPDYKAGTNITLRIRAKRSAAPQVSGTLDAIVKRHDGDGALGSDICATAAQSLTGTDAYADYNFTITGTTLSAGDILNLVGVIALDDTGGTNSVEGHVAAVSLLYTGREAQ